MFIYLEGYCSNNCDLVSSQFWGLGIKLFLPADYKNVKMEEKTEHM